MDAQWIVGTLVAVVGLVVTIIAGIIVRDRQTHAGIRDGDDKIRGEFKLAVDQLHARVNDVRESYVRRDDFDKFADRIEASVGELRSEVGNVRTDVGQLARTTERMVATSEGNTKMLEQIAASVRPRPAR